MKMKDNENIAQYNERIKDNVNVIRASSGKIDDIIVVSKVLITLLPIYAIRVSAIQEILCDPKNDINLDALVGRLTTLHLYKYDGYVPNFGSIRSVFQDKLSLKKKGGKYKRKKSDSEDGENYDDDL